MTSTSSTGAGLRDRAEWKRALSHAIPISLFTAGLLYYWFAVADRYVIFLYGHLGATPFDRNTTSRYWMAGLVASGAVMVLYTVSNWFLGRALAMRCRRHAPPVWWRVWLLCAFPLAVSIPAITTTFNEPTLPLSTAIACTVVTLIGLALALSPGAAAAQRPLKLGWLILAGAGLMPSLLLLRAVELPARGLVSACVAYPIAAAGPLAGATWSVIIAWLYTRQYKLRWRAPQLLVTGLCMSYLLMPLVHHVMFTPPEYRYISNSANFFALSSHIQLTSFLVTVVLAVGITKLQRGWIKSSATGVEGGIA